MKVWILSTVLLSSLFMGCSSLNKNEEVLKDRSVFKSEFQNLNLGVSKIKKLRMTKSGVTHAWRHETELPNGDYFWGGWLSIVISKPQWAKPPKH